MRVKSKKTYGVVAVFLSVLIVSSFSTTPVLAQAPKYGGTLIQGLNTEPTTLAGLRPTFFDIMASNGLYNTLVAFDKDLNWIPELAKSWEIDPNGLYIRFNLRDDVYWHDGVKFTSADVQYSILNISCVHNSGAQVWGKSITEIETPDDYTAIFHFSTPEPSILGLVSGLSGNTACILPRHIFEGTDATTNPANFEPIGTGPWMFDEWVRGDHITYVRNPNYWKEGIGTSLPYLERYVFRIVGDPTAVANQFETGEIDYAWAYGLTVPDALRLSDMIAKGQLPERRVWFHDTPTGWVDRLVFNTPEPPLDDVRVRRAIGYAIDLEKMNRVIFNNEMTIGTGPVAVNDFLTWYYNPDAQQPGYDPEEAKRLLDDAGHEPDASGKRFSLRLPYTTAYFAHEKECELIKDDLAAVGIDVELIRMEDPTFHDAVFVRWDFDMCIIATSSGADPQLISRYYNGKWIKNISWSNNARYNNSEVNALLDASETEWDRIKRGELVKQASQIIVDEMPSYWMICMKYISCVNTHFRQELQSPVAFEFSGGFGGQRLEGVYDDREADSPPWVTPTTTPTTPEFSMWIGVVLIALTIVPAAYSVVQSKKKQQY